MWTPEQLVDVLGVEGAQTAARIFHVTAGGTLRTVHPFCSCPSTLMTANSTSCAPCCCGAKPTPGTGT